MNEAINSMRLQVITPAAVLVDGPVVKVVAEGLNGLFALLPRHIDIAAALVPGLLSYVTAEGREYYLGVDEGVLVKRGQDVQVSVLDAFESDDLSTLRVQVADRFRSLAEHERAARTAVARLEAGAIRHVLEFDR